MVSGASLILASASPQRRAILEQLGVTFEVRPAGVAELDRGDPRAVASENARRKALAVPGAGVPVLGADTVVSVDGRPLGKPGDADEARAMIAGLAGRRHEVIGGVAVARDGALEAAGVASTLVRFRTLSPAAIDAYVAAGEWRGRAGGYAIQLRGALLVAAIEGDYLNVVGLPVALLCELAPAVVGAAW